jgi:hypothetical protein
MREARRENIRRLIELFRDLDLTAQGASHSVAVLQRWQR